MKPNLSGYINTATPMHEIFTSCHDVVVDENIGCGSDSSSSSVSQVYRQRHISNKDQRFASIALDEAAKSTLLMQHGCIAVLSGKVIAKGCNNIRSHSKDGLLHYQKCCSGEISYGSLERLEVRFSSFKKQMNAAPNNQPRHNSDTDKPLHCRSAIVGRGHNYDRSDNRRHPRHIPVSSSKCGRQLPSTDCSRYR